MSDHLPVIVVICVIAALFFTFVFCAAWDYIDEQDEREFYRGGSDE